MRTIEVKLYQFDELDEHAKERAREWYRHGIEEDSFWSEAVIEDAVMVLERMGFSVDMQRGTKHTPAIYFSGFSSQGDGACFEGAWSPSSIMERSAFVAEYPAHGTNPDGTAWTSDANAELQRIHAESVRLAELDPAGLVGWRTRHTGRDCHENSVTFEYDDERNENDETGDMPAGIEDAHTENARDAMRWVYRQLKREWDYRNSNEVVDEEIRANEYEFQEDGTRA